MRNHRLLSGLFIIVIVFIKLAVSEAQTNQKLMSTHMEIQRLNKGKVVKISADIFLKYLEGNMVIHYTYPIDYVMITNKMGEAKMYVPKTNEVVVELNEMFSASSEAIYYFLTNNGTNLGLKESGFTMRNTKQDKGLYISEWVPPVAFINKISKVEIVCKDVLPVYSAVYNGVHKIVKKAYYSNFYYGHQVPFPQRITEIEYIKTGDSIVSRKIYSNVKFGANASSSYFDFRIPPNAKLVKSKKK